MVLSKHRAHVLMLAPTSTAFLTYAVSFPIHTPARARDHLCYYCLYKSYLMALCGDQNHIVPRAADKLCKGSFCPCLKGSWCFTPAQLLLCISLVVSSALWAITQTSAHSLCSHCLASYTGLPYPEASTKLTEIIHARSRDVPYTTHLIRNNCCRRKRSSWCKSFLNWQRNKSSSSPEHAQTEDGAKVQN